jgi:hypothetical protein
MSDSNSLQTDQENQGTPINNILSFPEALRLVLWKCHDNLIVSPDPSRRTESPEEDKLHPFKNLKSLAISPKEDALVYIKMKRKLNRWLFPELQKKIYVRRMTFDSDGNVAFMAPRKVGLLYPFDEASSLSMICENGEVRCFVAHGNGLVEKVVFQERSF